MAHLKDIHGILVINKPTGPSSHSIVVQVRRALKVKAGHTGTLDPMARGILPVLVGKGTRLARFYQGSDKEYRAILRLGIETDTYDAEGNIVKQTEVPTLSDTRVEELIRSFQGEQDQIPPMYSAIKVAGKSLYKSARRDETIERPTRRVVFHEIKLIERSPDTWTLDIHCSSGTYIRSLAHDIGRRLNCGAHLSSLIRTRSGPFTLEHSIHSEEISEKWQRAYIPLEQMLTEIAAYKLSPEEAVRVSHGNAIPYDPDISGTLRLLFKSQLVAIGESANGTIEPDVVLRTEL